MKKVHKWFWIWNQDKEKKFLEDMAIQGYRLRSVGFGVYEFDESDAQELVYQFDYRGRDRMSEAEYLQLYEDAGWTCAARFGSWYYFYRKQTGVETDLSLFNNNETKRAQYRRIILLLALTGFPLYYQALIFFPNLPDSDFDFPGFYFFMRIIVSILAILHVSALARIFWIYRKMKDPLKE